MIRKSKVLMLSRECTNSKHKEVFRKNWYTTMNKYTAVTTNMENETVKLFDELND